LIAQRAGETDPLRSPVPLPGSPGV